MKLSRISIWLKMIFNLKSIKNKIFWMIVISIWLTWLNRLQISLTKWDQVWKVKTRSLLRMKMIWYSVRINQKWLISIWLQQLQGSVRVSHHLARVSRIGAQNFPFRTNRTISTLQPNQGFKKCNLLLNLRIMISSHRKLRWVKNMRKP